MRIPRILAVVPLLLGLAIMPALAQSGGPNKFSSNELVNSGHKFFGNVSRGLAMAIEKATSQWGQPNGYILGQEGGGAFVAGLNYGEGTLYTRNAGDMKVYWQGPSLGFDVGADGARTMMLVYNLPSTEAIYQRFGGVEGSAYLVGGFGMTALTANNIVVVPIRRRRWPAARRQSRLPQIHAKTDLEPALSHVSATSNPQKDKAAAGFRSRRPMVPRLS